MSPDAAAEMALRARLLEDAEFLALVGGEGSRVTPHWPTEEVAEASFPREVLTVVAPIIRRPGIGRVVIQTTSFVWEHRTTLLAMGERKIELLDEQHWTWEDPDGGRWRLYATHAGGSDLPSARHPIARRQDYRIEVARA